MTIERVEFDLGELLDNLSSLFLSTVTQSRLRFSITLEEGTPTRLVGDPLRLQQALTNLIGNAIKFTKEGSVTVDVRTAGATDAAATLLFVIADTGIGIAADEIDQLFSPFAQVDSKNSRKYGGTGLGLAISQRLVRMMGGRLRQRALWE